MIENHELEGIDIIPQKSVTYEYRVYYDETGKILQYTTQKLSGNYIVITREQYAFQNLNAVVLNGVLVDKSRKSMTTVLVKNFVDGVSTSKYDISVLQNGTDSVYWNLVTYDN